MVCAAAIILASVAPAKGQAASGAAGYAGRKTVSPAASPAVKKTPKPKSRHGAGPSLYPLAPGEYGNRLWPPPVEHALSDQHAIWTSPLHLRTRDAGWLLPLGGMAAGLFATDRQFSRHLPDSPSRLQRFNQFSNYGAYGMIAGTGAMYFWGLLRHDEHMREAGFLGGEAVIGGLLTTEALKYSFQRARPQQPGAGEFWNGGTSFPSEHATAAWALAGMIAHEYPGPLTKILAYGLASAISLSRVEAKQHFPSDVLVGSTIGYLIARHVFLAHHDPELGGGSWPLFPALRDIGERSGPANMGSPYVPLGSWVYPAFERLAALGYVRTEMLGMRPWTRLECARLVSEAEDRLDGEGANPPAAATRIVQSLEKEFRSDLDLLGKGSNRSAVLESVYTRVTQISGQPLTDGYHFGQTLYSDYGRPYEEGTNVISGFTGWGAYGPLVGYVQGEFQHAPSGPPLPAGARQTIAQVDGLPASLAPPGTPVPETNRFELLDSYVGMNFHDWQVTFGKQSLWWGPGMGGALMLSDNAEPIEMFRIDRVEPFRLPGILGFFGPIRMEFFAGQLEGQHFVFTGTSTTGSWLEPLNPQPMTEGEKVSFKPTPNIEIGLSYTTMFGGAGVPATLGTFWNSLLDTGGELPNGTSKSSRYTGLDFTYRLPMLRNWVTLYADGFAHDELIFNPTGYPERAVWLAGIYMPRLPGLAKFDLRVEGGYTNSAQGGAYSSGFYYTANRYLSGDTNNGNVLGSWLGRAGQGVEAWLTYWQSPRSWVRFEFRHQKVSREFLDGGGTISDGGVRANLWVRPDLSVSTLLQYEKWDFPILRPGPTADFTTSVQLTYWPRWSLR